MTDERLYELSQKLNTYFSQNKNMLALSLLRYKHLVDNSDKGFDCVYARVTAKNFREQAQSELDFLQSRVDSLTDLLLELRGEAPYESIDQDTE